MIYDVRLVCETETGDGKGFHYWEETQNPLDDTIACGIHPAADTRDFTIMKEY